MKRMVNLLPLSTQSQLEQHRQFRVWGGVCLTLCAFMALSYVSTKMNVDQLQHARDMAEAEVVDLRNASAESRRAEIESKRLQRLVEDSELIEQKDVPLALIQTIAECCNADDHLQIDSLRIDELTVAAEKNKVAIPKKQILMNGLADSDIQVSVLVNRLNSSQMFSMVDLISSQAQSEDSDSRRSFQIRCQQ
jgi:Tfp pilus assembly protein PilN